MPKRKTDIKVQANGLGPQTPPLKGQSHQLVTAARGKKNLFSIESYVIKFLTLYQFLKRITPTQKLNLFTSNL